MSSSIHHSGKTMKLRTPLSVLMLAAAMALPALAMAQGHDDQHDDHAPAQADHGHDARPGAKAAGKGDNKPNAHANERGAGPSQQFHRGDRLSSDFRDKRYVVSDWRGHHLSAPPRGYHWVQTGNDFVLAAIATGVIAEILVNQ